MRFTFLLIFIVPFSLFAQVGINTENPDPSSILDISSTTQGMLTPRVTTTQKNAIASPATGLLVFDTDLGIFSLYSGTEWIPVGRGSADDFTGWADYSDTQYTSAAPFQLSTTKVTLPNNAGNTVDSQKPIDITTFYDPATQTITGRNGDGINITFEFKIRPTSNQATRVTVSIDIGGTVGEIYTRDFVTSKGVNQENFYISSFNAYTLNTWETNGGAVKVVASSNVDIYDIRYVITRTHKAR